jgi:DNA modification methylase
MNLAECAELFSAELRAAGADLSDLDTCIPRLAKSPQVAQALATAVSRLDSCHRLWTGDARTLEGVGDGSVHLVLTSPPYWTLKRYRPRDGQLGHVADYEAFLAELRRVWAECLRVLAPGGRLIVVVGDVCLSRRQAGRHQVIPLHAAIQEQCRRIGFDNLAPIFWYKISNAQLEVENGSRFLGKPYEPNAVIKHDVEYILMLRKPGAYRSPTAAQRLLSWLGEAEHREFFQQIWTLPGASTRAHPAPFPLDLAQRLVRMFSFAGDTVLDPFTGTGTTNAAAAMWGRSSIGIDVEPNYVRLAEARLRQLQGDILRRFQLEVVA